MRPAFATCGLVCAVVFTTGAEARAAFIAPAIGLARGESASLDCEERGASSLQNRSHPLETPAQPGQPDSRFYFRTGRGMTSTSTSVPAASGATSVAVPAMKVQLTGGRLVMRWEREGACELPPPHLEGVFRPPRE